MAAFCLFSILWLLPQLVTAKTQQGSHYEGSHLSADHGSKDSSHWSFNPTLGLFFSQQGHSAHFKGGGLNSTALSARADLLLDRKLERHTWTTRMALRYGVIKVAQNPLQKNQDHCEVDSKYSHQLKKHLQVSGILNFTTRFHDFYELNKNGELGKRIGNFLSPAYLNLGTGIDYVTKDKSLSLFYTPVNSKLTLVKDPSLVNQYLPLANQERGARYELGSLLRVELKKEIFKNIHLHSISNFFTNHLESFGSIDVKIENQFNFKVNKFFSVNLVTSLIYDEDILFEIPSGQSETKSHKGPRTQFREVLNIGLSHTF